MGIWYKCTIRAPALPDGHYRLSYAFWCADPPAGATAESICIPWIGTVEYQSLLQLFLPWNLSIRRSCPQRRQWLRLHKRTDHFLTSPPFAGVALPELSAQLSFFF